jgi:hypothetical protein
MVRETRHGSRLLFKKIDRTVTRLARREFDVVQRGTQDQRIVARKRVRIEGRTFRIRVSFDAANGHLKITGRA